MSDYQSKIDILIRENDELAKRILLFEGNLTADSIWESKIREFEYRISQLTREIERLLAIILLRDEEILLLKSNKNITTIISDDKYKIKYETLLKDFHLLESNMEINIRKIKELEEKFILLAHEKDILERNNKELLEIKFKIETEYNEFRIGHGI